MTAMFEAVLTDEEGREYTYAHCFYDDDDGNEYGCGMEYAYYAEDETLEHWHDAVGLVTRRTGFTEARWRELSEHHDQHTALLRP
jgi:hypothetical protein